MYRLGPSVLDTNFHVPLILPIARTTAFSAKQVVTTLSLSRAQAGYLGTEAVTSDGQELGSNIEHDGNW
jgi:hypothetical protein